MGGRLLNFSDNWKEWGTSQYVWNMINQDVRLSSNPSFWKKFHQRQFNKQESEWIRAELLKMLQLKIIGPESSQIVLNPINVVPKKGKDIFRFILDLRMINGGIEVTSFKMDTLLKCIKFFKKGMWVAKIDLKKGYFHIPIHPESQHLLRFQFEGMVFEFHCLPFGLAPAPIIFTKIFNEIIIVWRSNGIMVYIYIDDMLILAFSLEELWDHIMTIVLDLLFLG